MCLTTIHPDAIRATILLNEHVSLAFKLPVDLSAFTIRQLNDACDVVENKIGFYRVTILPPVDQASEFEVHAEENGVLINLPELRKMLMNALGVAP